MEVERWPLDRPVRLSEAFGGYYPTRLQHQFIEVTPILLDFYSQLETSVLNLPGARHFKSVVAVTI